MGCTESQLNINGQGAALFESTPNDADSDVRNKLQKCERILLAVQKERHGLFKAAGLESEIISHFLGNLYDDLDLCREGSEGKISEFEDKLKQLKVDFFDCIEDSSDLLNPKNDIIHSDITLELQWKAQTLFEYFHNTKRIASILMNSPSNSSISSSSCSSSLSSSSLSFSNKTQSHRAF